MTRDNVFENQNNIYGVDLSKCRFLGQGHSGRVYLMPDGRVIKIFKNEESCVRECMILQSVRGDTHFPVVYECRGNHMIREYVGGINIKDYIKRYGLNRVLAMNLIWLIEDFKRLGFSKLDMRCAHIFVQPGESVKVIDPRNHYTENVPYPRNLLHNLKELRVLGQFMIFLRESRPLLYKHWIRLV